MENKVLASEIYNKFNKNNDIVDVSFNGIKFKVKKYLDFESTLILSKSIIDTVFSDKNRDCSSETKHFAIRFYTIIVYTNIETDIDLLSEYEIVYRKDKYGNTLYDTIMSAIDVDQYEDILMSIEEKIANKEELEMITANAEITKLMSQIESVKDELEKIFKDINIDEMTEALSTIVSNGFDEEKIARAVIDSKK